MFPKKSPKRGSTEYGSGWQNTRLGARISGRMQEAMELEVEHGYKLSKLSPSVIQPPARPHLLNFPN